jgi:hypothetical protein
MPVNRTKIVINKGLPTPRPQRQINQGPTHYFFDDPSTPELAAEMPLGSTPLPIAIQGYLGGSQPVGSLGWQAATSAITIGTAMRYITSKSKKAMTRWAATNVLMVMVRAGEDLNAYYDRQALRFFYIKDPVLNKLVFACDAASVVAHELGHAVLDILRPDFWNATALEVFAFHEAFGDCHAILEMMQHDPMIQHALNETNNNLLQSSVISRLAKQMGLCAYHLAPPAAGYNPAYLRNAVNDFKYVQPETLPEDTSDTLLSKEPHNFSRIWTGAWWEFLAKLHRKLHLGGMDSMTAARQARDTAAEYLLNAVIDVPNTTRLFDALARQMLVADGLHGSPHRDILLEVFNGRNILIEKVMAMSDTNASEVAALPDAEVVTHVAGQSVYVRKTRMLKMANHTVSALGNHRANPLYNVHVEVPMESVYHFDNEGVMVDGHEADEDEAVRSARHCLDYLHNHQMVSPDPKTAFEITKDNALLRSHACGAGCGCNKNNACDPNAPEYQKGYKGNNNAGCGCKGCGSIPVCGCNPPEPTPRPKLGCYTKVSGSGAARYSRTYGASRKVC